VLSNLFLQVEDDLAQGVDGAIPIPTDDAGKEEVIAALVANVEAMIKADRKITALKQLQVSIQKHKVGNHEIDMLGIKCIPVILPRFFNVGSYMENWI